MRSLSSSAVLGMALLVAGCAFASKDPAQAVRERALDYWQARIARDMGKAYALTPPSYRKLRTLDQYRSKFGPSASFKSAEVSDVACGAEKCDVKMKVGVSLVLPGMSRTPLQNYVNETWVLEEGRWWRFEAL